MDNTTITKSDSQENQTESKKKSISSRLGIHCPTNKVKEIFIRKFHELSPIVLGQEVECKTANSITPLIPTFIDMVIREYISGGFNMLVESGDKTLNVKHFESLSTTDLELNIVINRLITCKNMKKYEKEKKAKTEEIKLDDTELYKKNENKDFLNMISKIYKDIRDKNDRTEHISMSVKTYVNDLIYELIEALALILLHLYKFEITKHKIINNNIVLYSIFNLCKDMSVLKVNQIMDEVDEKKTMFNTM